MGLVALPIKPENSCGANRLWLHLTTATLVLSVSLILGSGAPGGLTILPVAALEPWVEESGTMEYQSWRPLSVLLMAAQLAGSILALLAFSEDPITERRFLVKTAMALFTLESCNCAAFRSGGGGGGGLEVRSWALEQAWLLAPD